MFFFTMHGANYKKSALRSERFKKKRLVNENSKHPSVSRIWPMSATFLPFRELDGDAQHPPSSSLQTSAGFREDYNFI